ncbi:hypothetical protein Hgul01_01856 [Herpetosiphon gulosus]|uniref:Uncharacterized protein n=1 Tax=Herpetosiphon gulosus TaxID=1973496 RepID=A0ABP9WY44_9CHLR
MLYCFFPDRNRSSVRVGMITQTIALLVSFLPAMPRIQQRSWSSRYLLAWSPNDEHTSCLGLR